MSSSPPTPRAQSTPSKDVSATLGAMPCDGLDAKRLHDSDDAVLAATQSLTSLKGLIAKPKTPATLADMDDAIARGSAGK